MSYGLRFFDGEGREWRLAQIAPGPRLTLSRNGHNLWSYRLPVLWEPFETSEGLCFESEEEARRAADALSPQGAHEGAPREG